MGGKYNGTSRVRYMIGIVLYSEVKSRMVTIVDTSSGTQVANLTVPINVQGVTKDCVVAYDPKDRIVTAVIAYERNCLGEDFVPGAKASVAPVVYDNRQSAAVREGDELFQRPGTGFMYLLRGFKSIIGASLFSRILFDGTADAVTLFARKMRILDGDSIDVSVLSDRNTTPVVKMKIGKLEFSSDTNSMLKIALDSEMISLTVTKSGIVASMFGHEVFNHSIADDSIAVNLAKSLRSQLVKAVIDIKEGLTVMVGGEAALSGQSIIMSAMKVFSLTGQTMSLMGTVLLRLDGQNIAINAKGNNGSGGDINMKAGMLSGMSFKGMDGSVKVKGMSMELLGKGEHVANGDATQKSLDSLYKTVDAMLTAISAASKNPLCAPLSALDPLKTLLINYNANAPFVVNSYIELPSFVPNGSLP